MSGAFANAVIRLDTEPAGVYYSGQVISGSVIFDLDQTINYSVIYIHYLGEGKVLWTESEIETVHGVEKHKMVKYEGREQYINFTQQLAGGTGVSHLPAGGQSFPFKFQIPYTAPSSFKGEQGEISYSMTVHLVYAEPSILKEEMTKNFKVVAPFDLNVGSPRIRQPIDMEFEEVYGCGCFCNPDPVTIRIRLPVSGYCPGQAIPVAVEVQNESTVEITKMIFELVTKELYRSTRPASEYIPPEKILVTTKKGPVMAHSKRNFTCDVLVPEMLPPYLENCGIIDVGYFFRITIKLSGCNDELQDESEICLGLVPVRELIEGEYVHPLADQLPTGPIPAPDGSAALTVPPVVAGFAGSNTSLHRIQQSNVQNAPPQYPSGNIPYPTENRFQAPVSIEQKPPPYCDYEIGFKVTGIPAAGMPYPGNVASPPYPGTNLMPAIGQPPYPTGNTAQGGLPPYGQVAFTPSAPPPTD